MKRIIILLMFGVCSASAQPRITVGPSETTELLSVIMHLSGAEEYNNRKIWPKYTALVDSVFAPYKDHAVMQVVRDMRSGDGWGMVWEKPMMLAVNARIENGEFRAKYYQEEYSPYWNEEEHKRLLDAVNDFYRDANFHEFYTEQAMPLYAAVSESMETLYNGMLDIEWISEFSGIAESRRNHHVTLSYLNYSYNYGVTIIESNDPRPVVSLDRPWILNGDFVAEEVNWHGPMVLLHEILHHYLDPLNDKYADAFAPSGEALFPPIREKIEPYDPWSSVTNEMLVRGPVIAYMLTHDIYKKHVAAAIAEEKAAGFWWIEEFVGLLMDEYMPNRDQYPTLESFMPRIVKFYDDLAAEAARERTSKITVGPSETTELLSVIMHLAGREGYNDPAVWPEYRALIDSIFAPYKEHPAVAMARQSSMSGDMPVLMAVHGRFENGKFLSPYDTPYLSLAVKYFDWSEERHNKFLDAINDFYRETRFHDLYTEQLESKYEQVEEQLERRFNGLIDLAWLEEYTGIRKPMSYFVTLSYLNSPNNYGYEVDGVPRPVMGVKNTGRVGIHFTMILLHEYLHSYINPICDAYSDMLRASGEILFPPISGIVGYPDWESVQYEALINASVVAYMRHNDLLKEHAENEIAISKAEGFWWVGELADLLDEYQDQRDQYPTLESFMPRIVKFYDDLAAEAAREQAE